VVDRNGWAPLPFADWQETCDTLHAHTQTLGKLAARLAPPEPQLQHAALRLTARGWETNPLPAIDRSAAVVIAIDLHAHETLVEHSSGRVRRVPLTPNRPVGDVTTEVVRAVTDMVGPVAFDPTPQEVSWTVPLDEDHEHATYDVDHVAAYFAAATSAAAVLGDLRAPFRGRSTPVNAWWGSFDLAVSLFSGAPAEPSSTDFITRNAMDAEEIAIGWWPGDTKHPRAAFYAYAHPAPPDYGRTAVEPQAARWDGDLGEYVLDWDDVVADPDPHGAALRFARSAVRESCTTCGWDPALAASVDGDPPPVR
jgi:hypothetical protein